MTWRIRSRQADGESGGARSVEGEDSDGVAPDRLRRLLFLSGTKTSFHIHNHFRKHSGKLTGNRIVSSRKSSYHSGSSVPSKPQSSSLNFPFGVNPP